MTTRRSLRLPILLAVAMTALLAVLTVGWILLTVFGASQGRRPTAIFWTFLAVGTSFIGLLLAGVVVYLILTIKAVNLTRRQSNFIDSVTHELRSPLASMKLYLQTLGKHRVGDAEREEFLAFLLEDVERLDRLVGQILIAARLDAGRREGEEEAVDLAGLLTESAEAIRQRHRAPEEALRLDLEPCTARGRRADLEILLHNLLDNAFKYAGTPPRVRAEVRVESERTVVVRIGDNGPGVPPRQRRRIFRRFVRLGSELERERTGTGLGLHIARAIVRRVRGRIRVTDAVSGPGAVFEVRLPRTAAAPVEASGPPKQGA